MVSKSLVNGNSIDLPARRVVLLGASNLTRGIATVIETSCRAWGRPLDVLAAAGHGRSYGTRSRVLARALPGITECALWPALASRPAAPTAALITDIGNDLFYDATPETIASWVEECCRRLEAYDARLVMTRLPVSNVGRLQPWQYQMFRTLLYPACRLSLEALARRARELDDRVQDVARRHDCRLIEPQAHWYGVDPVHVKLLLARGVWKQILEGWSDALDGAAPPASMWRWIYLHSRAPQQRWFFGCEQRGPQPCGRLPDGTLLSFY
ncbi:MAG TPA: hypothetical protein VG125_21755 [Pirellulales bacterium]|jgi:hypothetical protein|nr:hypothetical protein [Pirellulales bacterium]